MRPTDLDRYADTNAAAADRLGRSDTYAGRELAGILADFATNLRASARLHREWEPDLDELEDDADPDPDGRAD